MVKLGLIPFSSNLCDRQALNAEHEALLAELHTRFEISFIEPEEIDRVDVALIFIANGGVEAKFREMYPRFSHALPLLADGLHNSLAAAMEILTWLKNHKASSEILHGDIQDIISRINRLYRINIARKKLKETVVGVLGGPSGWLIAGRIEPLHIHRDWGIAFRKIEFQEFQEYRDRVRDSEVKDLTAEITEKAESIEGPIESDIMKSIRLYIAMKNMVEELHLQAVTVRCFDFIPEGITGCLALSLLNNIGIIAGCEGDCQTVCTMLLANLLTDEIPFMANPSLIDKRKNEIVLAHCTVATHLAKRFCLRSHFESGIGVAIQGKFKPGPVTLLKWGGSHLHRSFISAGKLVKNLEDPRLCRTQIEIALNESVEYFLRDPIGNHHVVVSGDHVEILKEFLASTPNREDRPVI